MSAAALAPRPAASEPDFIAGLAVRRFGAGPNLILFHGGVGSWTHWSRNIPGLARSFTVLAFDLPGYGDSEAPEPSIGPEAYLDHVAEAVSQALGPGGTAGLCGFSFGAVNGAAVARRLPETITHLSLIAPGGLGQPVGRSIPLKKLPETDGPELRETVAFNLGQWMLSAAPEPDDPVVDLQLVNIRGTRFDSRRISLTERLIDDLRATRCPLQLIWGERDPLAYPSIAARAERCREARPDARVDLVPAGHWAAYEAPEEVNRLVTMFTMTEGASPPAAESLSASSS